VVQQCQGYGFIERTEAAAVHYRRSGRRFRSLEEAWRSSSRLLTARPQSSNVTSLSHEGEPKELS
jgi:hypothetical protein